jgi:hypothetical protein
VGVKDRIIAPPDRIPIRAHTLGMAIRAGIGTRLRVRNRGVSVRPDDSTFTRFRKATPWQGERRCSLFPQRVAQLRLGRFHFARRLATEQNATQLITLIIACDEFLFRVGAMKIDTGGQHAEITDKIHP